MCGVVGSKGWECVDTETDKESCESPAFLISPLSGIHGGSVSVGGGCMAPAPFPGEKFVQGRDCTALPHVVSGGVECLDGACRVHECEHGYEPSVAHDACVPVGH